MGSSRTRTHAGHPRVTIVLAMSPEPTPPKPLEELDPEDFYFDGHYLVFTAAYHLKRGTCCNSGCRHCPYK
jgi:hypothetical protein